MSRTDGGEAAASGVGDRIALSDRLYEAIRDRILLWDIEPNEILVEARLAEEYEVSRTPVRQALALLGQDGLVEVMPRVGYRVSSISLQDVHEIFDMRLLLEGEAAARAARVATDGELAALKTMHEEWANALEQRQTSPVDYLKYHDAFHLGIAELSGSQRLARYVAQLLREGMRLRMSDPLMSSLGLETEKEGSNALLSALMRHDADQARNLHSQHITDSKRRALQWLIEHGGVPGIDI